MLQVLKYARWKKTTRCKKGTLCCEITVSVSYSSTRVTGLRELRKFSCVIATGRILIVLPVGQQEVVSPYESSTRELAGIRGKPAL